MEKLITVTVSLFPPFSRAVAGEEIAVSLLEGSTMHDLLRQMGKNNRQLATRLKDPGGEEEIRFRMLIIHNGHLGRLDRVLREGDCIKLLQPLQGG
jgi:sulfur carrier protein ThiS